MREHLEDLAKTNVFSGIEPEEIGGLLDCLDARRFEYAKGDYLIEEGSLVHVFGVVLSGRGRSIKQDATGRSIIVTLLEKGSEIGIVLAASSDRKSPVSVEALEDVVILQIPFARVPARCERSCPRHDRLLRNCFRVVAEKGLILHERMNCLLQPSVRDKIMTYLSRVSREQGSRVITIPLDRKSMAEYLNVDRSVLSHELSKMKRDGVLDFHKSCFRLL